MLYESRHQKFLLSALPVKGAVSQHIPDPGQSYHIRQDSFVAARSSKHLITDGCCLFPAVGQQKASKSAAVGHRPQATLNTGCSSQARTRRTPLATQSRPAASPTITAVWHERELTSYRTCTRGSGQKRAPTGL